MSSRKKRPPKHRYQLTLKDLHQGTTVRVEADHIDYQQGDSPDGSAQRVLVRLWRGCEWKKPDPTPPLKEEA
jgi:hypothetical protein